MVRMKPCLIKVDNIRIMSLVFNNCKSIWLHRPGLRRMNRLTKPRCHLFTYCLLLAIATPHAFASCDQGTAIISGGTQYPPLSWRKDGKLVGTNVEMVQNIFAEVGIKATADEGGPWKRVLLRAKRGEVDLLLGVRKTVEREAFLRYVYPPVTPSAQGVFYDNNRKIKYDSWDDLKDKVGSMTLGVSFGKEFDTYMKKNLHVEPVRIVEQNFTKMELGRIDYILGPLMPTLMYLGKAGYANKISHTQKPLLIIDEYLAFSKNSSCVKYIDHFSKRVKQLLDNGSIDIIMEKYFMLWFDEEEKSNNN